VATEENYWYRMGYVSGDIYMRFFFRSTIDTELKIRDNI
jgi:hypothetical protein